MKDIDWKILLPIAGLALIGGAALGAFVVKPAWDKNQAKKKSSDKEEKAKPKSTSGAKS